MIALKCKSWPIIHAASINTKLISSMGKRTFVLKRILYFSLMIRCHCLKYVILESWRSLGQSNHFGLTKQSYTSLNNSIFGEKINGSARQKMVQKVISLCMLTGKWTVVGCHLSSPVSWVCWDLLPWFSEIGIQECQTTVNCSINFSFSIDDFRR